MAKAKLFDVTHVPDLKVGAIEYNIVRKVTYQNINLHVIIYSR